MLHPKEVDRYETQVLRFATEPFAKDTEMVGPITLSLALSSTAIDSYLTTRLSELAPSGNSRCLSFSYQRAALGWVDKTLSTPIGIARGAGAADAG